ncbi:MAG: DUF4625 domain-containing protein [Saprospiraceae bacterium]|nr:DUF4625 domain-containing protein [Saprospiraceae bacterium]
MNFRNLLSVVLIISAWMLLASCGGEADLIKPAITIQNFNISPKSEVICGFTDENVITVKGGEQITFDALFSDNEALSQYKIDIHNNFDCHGHGSGATPGISLPIANGDTEDWSLLIVKDLSGKKVEENISLKVPENVTAGVYHFIVQLIDESGNDASTSVIYSLKVNHPEDTINPVININFPSTSAFSVKKGDNISFSGTVTDNKNLGSGGNGMVF